MECDLASDRYAIHEDTPYHTNDSHFQCPIRQLTYLGTVSTFHLDLLNKYMGLLPGAQQHVGFEDTLEH
jgi:hypothetical protein